MEEDHRTKNKFLLLFFLFSFSSTAKADLIGTILSVGNILYGIAAGLAALMVVLHAIKWKTSESIQGREEAKRGIINVLMGLALITIAGALVSTFFINPESIRGVNMTATTRPPGPTTPIGSTTSSSSFEPTSSSITTPSTTAIATTTTLPISNNECYNAENGNLCAGLDFVYGEGTRTICCNAYGCCCNPITPGTCWQGP